MYNMIAKEWSIWFNARKKEGFRNSYDSVGVFGDAESTYGENLVTCNYCVCSDLKFVSAVSSYWLYIYVTLGLWALNFRMTFQNVSKKHKDNYLWVNLGIICSERWLFQRSPKGRLIIGVLIASLLVQRPLWTLSYKMYLLRGVYFIDPSRVICDHILFIAWDRSIALYNMNKSIRILCIVLDNLRTSCLNTDWTDLRYLLPKCESENIKISRSEGCEK